MSFRRQILCISLFFLVLTSLGVYTTYQSMQKTTSSNVEKPFSLKGAGEYLEMRFLGLEYACPKEELTYSSLRNRSAAGISRVSRAAGIYCQKARLAGQQGWRLLQEKLDRLRSGHLDNQ